MRLILLAASIAALCTPAFAHHGLIHTGCDPTATFTGGGGITVSGAFTRAMLPNAPTAVGYMTITSSGQGSDVLIGAHSEAAKSVTLHSMNMDGDMMKMAPVEGGISILPGESVKLESTGYHLMFEGIETPFAEGQCVEVTLEFEKGGPLPIVLSIGSPGASAPPAPGAAPAAADEPMPMPMDHKM